MSRNIKMLALVLLPVGFIILLIGWSLYYTGSKIHFKPKAGRALKEGNNVHFQVLLPEKQLTNAIKQ